MIPPSWTRSSGRCGKKAFERRASSVGWVELSARPNACESGTIVGSREELDPTHRLNSMPMRFWACQTVLEGRLLLALAADLLELGEDRVDIELVGGFLFFGLGLAVNGGLGGRQKRRALRFDGSRLFLGGAVHVEI